MHTIHLGADGGKYEVDKYEVDIFRYVLLRRNFQILYRETKMELELNFSNKR